MITVNRLITSMEASTLAAVMLAFVRGELTEAELIPIPDGSAQAKRLWEELCGSDHDRPQPYEPERGAKPYPRNFVQQSLRAQYFEFEGGVKVEIFGCEAHRGVVFWDEFLNFTCGGRTVRQLVSRSTDYVWTDIPPDKFINVAA